MRGEICKAQRSFSTCVAVAALFALAVHAPPVCAAAPFPAKSVRMIVPFPPAGGTDAFARIVAAELSGAWGQQVVIDNRSGAQGNLGTALGARAEPDGYTITIAHQGALTINPHLYASSGIDAGFDTLRDFAAVARGTATAPVLCVHPTVPADSLQEIVQYAKRNPGKLSFASTSSGQQLRQGLFMMMTGTEMLHVPYKGAGPAVVDLLAGRVTMMTSNPSSVMPHIQSGRLRAVAMLGDKRIEALPAVPSAVESGFPDLDIKEWYGFVAPAKTRPDVIAKLHQDIMRALGSADVRKRLNGLGQTLADPGTPEEFGLEIRKEFVRWGKVVKASGAKVE